MRSTSSVALTSSSVMSSVIKRAVVHPLEHQPFAKVAAQRLSDRLQHLKQLTFDGGHFFRGLSERRSPAKPASL